jgi:hypothetical protein
MRPAAYALAAVAAALPVLAARGAGSAYKISEVSLRLPLEQGQPLAGGAPLRVSYVLNAWPGCFEWLSSDESVVSARPLAVCPGGGASSAMLIVVTNGTGSCEVVARPEDGGDALTVDVRTAPIARIEIRTTARTLALFEPETVDVEAFDAEGNVFSSLEGLSFVWETSEEGAARGDARAPPLGVKKISESSVAGSPGLQQEHFGRFGYKVLLEGARTGPGVIRAALAPFGQDQRGPASEVVIHVVESMRLCPSVPVLMPGSSVAMRVLRKRGRADLGWVEGDEGGRYEWAVQGAGAAVDRSGSLRALEPGDGAVVFRQKGYEINAARSRTRVVAVDGLRLWAAPVEAAASRALGGGEASDHCPWSALSRFPQDPRLPARRHWLGPEAERWILVLGRHYFVMATPASPALANDTEVVFVTGEMHFSFHAAPTEVVEDVTEHKSPLPDLLPSVAVFRAARVGVLELGARFQMRETLLAAPSRQVQVVAPLALNRAVVRLPIDPTGRVLHSFALAATGGTGLYTFAMAAALAGEPGAEACSAPPAGGTGASVVAVVDAHAGRVAMREQAETNETLVARDTLDASNRAVASVLVSAPMQLRFREHTAQAALGDSVLLELTMLDRSGHAFDNCSGFQGALQWASHGHALELPAPGGAGEAAAPGVCAARLLRAALVGSSTVTVTFAGLTAAARVAVIERAHVVRPPASVARLMRGCGTALEVAGGRPQDDLQVLEVPADGSAPRLSQGVAWQHDVSATPGGSGHRVYRVSCAAGHGTYRVVAQQSATLMVHCGEASSARLALELDAERLASWEQGGCPALCGGGGELLHAVSGQAVRLRLDVLDAAGELFTDLRCADPEWSAEPRRGIELRGLRGAGEERKELALPAGLEGAVKVKVRATAPGGGVELSASLALHVSGDLAFEPPQLRPLLSDPAAAATVRVVGGGAAEPDCRFVPSGAASPAAGAITAAANRSLTVHFSGVAGGQAGGVVTCRAPCVLGSRAAELSVAFDCVASARVTGKLEAREGEQVQLFVQALDRRGRALSAEMLDFLAASVAASPLGLLQLPARPGPARCVGAAGSSLARGACEGRWELSALALASGLARVSVATAAPGGSACGAATAEPFVMRVYKGLAILPPHTRTVEPGSALRLRRAHGPFADPSQCKFAVAGAAIAVADEPKGLFSAERLGDAEVRAECRDQAGALLDSASVRVRVKHLERAQVLPAAAMLAQGGDAVLLRADFAEMGAADFDAVQRSYTWAVANASVARLRPASPSPGAGAGAGAGAGSTDRGAMSVLVEGVAPGETEVVLEAAPVGGRGGKTLTAVAHVAVVPRLALAAPRELLLPPGGAVRLVAPHVAAAQGLRFSLAGCGGACGEAAVSVGADGLVRAGDSRELANPAGGVAVVLVEQALESSRGARLVQRVAVLVTAADVAFVAARRPALASTADVVVPLRLPRALEVAAHDVNGRVFSVFPQGGLAATAGDDGVVEVSAAAALDAPGEGASAAAADDASWATATVYSFHRATLSARSEGTTTVVLSVAGRGGAAMRADFVRVQVVSPDAAFAFRLGTAGNKRGELVVAPGEPAVVAISVAPGVALGGAADGALDCAASLLSPHGAEAKQLPAALERVGASDPSSAELLCRFSVPSELQASAAARLQLLVGGNAVAQATFELALGFALSSSDLRIGAGGSVEWTLGGAGSRGTVEVVGAADAVTAVSSDASLISIAPEHELVAAAAAEATRRFTLERVTNRSCGGAPVQVVFQDVAKQQRVVLRVELPCGEGAAVALEGRRAGFLDSINLEATLMLTLALLIVAAIWLCSPPVAEPRRAEQPSLGTRLGPGSPLPDTRRFEDLGTWRHWRPPVH